MADVQETLFRIHALAEHVDAFQIRTYEDEQGDMRLVVSLEVDAARASDAPTAWSAPVFDTLALVNQDFRESRRMVPRGKEPSLELFAHGTGPFTDADIRIKRSYVLKRAG